MIVYDSTLFGILSCEPLGELVPFLENYTKKVSCYGIRLVQDENANLSDFKVSIGYHYTDSLPYISNPNKESGLGVICIPQKVVFWDKNSTSLSDLRDSYKYNLRELHSIGIFQEVLTIFEQNKFSFFEYAQKTSGDYIIRHRSFESFANENIGQTLNISDLV